MVTPLTRLDAPRGSFVTRDAVDLATNTLAGGPYPAVIAAITATARRAHAYPATTSQLLRDAIARRHRLDTNHVPVPGSITALQRLIDHHCTSGGQVMFSWPNFAAFPDLAAAHIHAKSAITVYVRTGMIASLVGEEMTPLLHAPGSFFGG